MRSRYCTIEAMKLTTDRYEPSHGLFATAELLVILWPNILQSETEVAYNLKWYNIKTTYFLCTSERNELKSIDEDRELVTSSSC